ncbi:RNA polymerase sigma24 factor [Virgisporangium aliadipatigenens]|uniref:RNA polymerase sigma24 factor n=1 Tax=Virgisporangium aliadipatigenens TaxID=741659 RepID=A0A8J3YVE6_9ACTN|nr:DUF6596 domain-containing protein [Virgisporangium aliadipatigenens]GIJ51217.1 RNA polymerase sigma24 factor [Virgisporangium aliadipatigenens]
MEQVLREATPHVLGALVRRYGHFDTCEEAVQEALLAAAAQWPEEGLPDNPRAWLITVASRRLIDRWRSDQARRNRELALAAQAPVETEVPDRDDTLTLLVLCCHPALTPASQIALTLRAVGGLSTAQIAAAFLVPEATMAQRISRAKSKIKEAGATFGAVGQLGAVLHVLYLIFNEGYTATSGPDLHVGELTGEAIRLTREVHRLRPDEGEVAGLLALMLLTEARSAARTTPDGTLVPLADQDRTRWDRAMVDEGIDLITRTMANAPIGPYQLQAAIAAVHAEAATAKETDWPQIVALYEVLGRLAPNPMVSLNHAIAVAMADGPEEGLALLAKLGEDDRLKGHHRLEATRAHLLERAGDLDAARAAYRTAARLTTSLPERRYLSERAAGL